MSPDTIVDISDTERLLRKNAIRYLQRRHPSAMTFDGRAVLLNAADGCSKPFWAIIVQDWQAGAKYRSIAMLDINASIDPADLASELPEFFAALDKNAYFEVGDSTGKRPSIASVEMPLVGRFLIYTNEFRAERQRWIEAFRSAGHVLDIVEERELFKSVFVSYGGPDAGAATIVNRELKARGVRTWFFPVDAVPGQKLHRVMFNGVNDHDRVLLLCSRGSLSRPGLLNELERVFEREAAEGGSDILIPMTFDDCVYGDWAPERKDLAAQVRARVIGKFPANMRGSEFHEQIERLLSALKLSG